MIVKLVGSDSFDFGVNPAHQVKLAHSGLRGYDLSAFIKRAHHTFVTALDQLRLARSRST